MSKSVGICEVVSYLISLFHQQSLYLYFLVIKLGHGHPTLIHF